MIGSPIDFLPWEKLRPNKTGSPNDFYRSFPNISKHYGNDRGHLVIFTSVRVVDCEKRNRIGEQR